MASLPKSLKLTATQIEIATIRQKRCRLKSLNAYFKSLLRYDAMVQGEHSITQPINEMSLEEQDRVDARLLDITRRGKGERGRLLTHIIERANGNPEQAAQLLLVGLDP